MKLLYLLAIAGRAPVIDIESPYLITDESSRWSHHEARKRGVRIRMLVEGDKTDAKTVKFASRGDYESLLEDGIEIAEYQPTMMHAKAMVIDGSFEHRRVRELRQPLAGAERRVECRGLRSAGWPRGCVADFEQDLTESKKLDLDSWRSRPVLESGRDWLWSYFGEVF